MHFYEPFLLLRENCVKCQVKHIQEVGRKERRAKGMGTVDYAKIFITVAGSVNNLPEVAQSSRKCALFGTINIQAAY